MTANELRFTPMGGYGLASNEHGLSYRKKTSKHPLCTTILKSTARPLTVSLILCCLVKVREDIFRGFFTIVSRFSDRQEQNISSFK